MLGPVGLVLVGILSVQLGAAIAKSLFGEISPTAMVWLRLVTSALVLAAIARPRLTGRSGRDWLVVLAFGASLATMNWGIYQSMARIPGGRGGTRGGIGPRARAGAAGVPIRFATITPVNGSWPYPCEEQRVEVNDWLRTLPGTIDMETRVSTPAGLLRSAYDYQDGLHFNARGYEAMGRFALRTVRADLARIVARKASTRN